MTPLKPIENTTRMRGVASTRYPLNGVCANPECDRKDVTAHHIFGRFPGENGDSWFVSFALVDDDGTETRSTPLPHVVGLCGHGTEGCHGDVEAHRTWIKYEDGVFVLYRRPEPDFGGIPVEEINWQRVGPLNPQPGSREGRPKRRRRKKGDGGGPVATWSVRAPQDDPDAVERVKDKVAQLQTKFEDAGHEIGPTVTLERALDYTILNAGTEDF